MDILEKLISIADNEYDGHFTLMKFTTNWRCCFGSVYDTMVGSRYMAEGKTMEEAIQTCIEKRVDSIGIYEAMIEDGVI